MTLFFLVPGYVSQKTIDKALQRFKAKSGTQLNGFVTGSRIRYPIQIEYLITTKSENVLNPWINPLILANFPNTSSTKT